MAIFLIPAHFARHGELFRQLGQMTAAGVPVTRALSILERNPPKRAYKPRLTATIAAIENGSTFHEAVAASRGWLPPFDLALIDAGEKSGRLEAAFHLLANYYGERARLGNQVLADLAYPIFLAHAAPAILAFPQLFLTGDVVRFLLTLLFILGPFYLLAFVVIYACQSRHGEAWRAMIERLTHWIPKLGKGRRELALSRLAGALEALLSAGVTVIEAWQLAGAACASPRLHREITAWLPRMRAGETPAEIVQDSRLLPEVFSGQYASGEFSGKLDDTLRRLSEYYEEEGTRKIRSFSQWMPRIVYLIIAGVIAYKIVSFWGGYFDGLGKVMDF